MVFPFKTINYFEFELIVAKLRLVSKMLCNRTESDPQPNVPVSPLEGKLPATFVKEKKNEMVKHR